MTTHLTEHRLFLPLAALLAAAALSNGCSCGNKCSGVTCPSFTACNASDGLCYCGGVDGDGGRGDVVCGANEQCDGTLLACVSTLCQSRDGGACANGTTCDPADGQCKCGGQLCATGQLCDPIAHLCESNPACQGVSCSGGESCDPRDGTCECGDSPCAAGQLCADGGCLADPCFGVNCSGQNNACFGGTCRCGSETGPTCNEEQFCDGTACRENSICINVACGPGSVCGPRDGFCHCGGSVGPICRGGSTCVLYLPDSGLPPPPIDAGPPTPGVLFGLCLGGDLCAGVECEPGEVCDPGSGQCLCGSFDAGTAPARCAAGQFCGPSPSGTGAVACLTQCNPYGAPCPPLLPSAGGLDASVPQSCFFEAAQSQLLCEPTGHDSEGDPCVLQADCPTSYTCATPPQTLVDAGAVTSCRQLCNSFDGGTLGCNVQDRQCFPLALVAFDGGVIPVGACWPPLPPDAGSTDAGF